MARHNVLFATTAIVCVIAASPAYAQERPFDLPAQSAQTGIRAFGRQADVQILAARKATQGRATNALRGNLSVEEGLKRLLQGTGLVPRRTGPQTYTVVSLAGPVANLQAATARSASFAPGPQAATKSAPADAPTVQIAASDAGPPAPDVVVTGSRIARPGLTASTPVTVLGAEEIKLSGNANVERTLQQLPQVTSNATGSAFGNQVPNGGFASVNLRGFGANRNLVLVNGRRFTIFDATGVTDLNTVPSSLIQRTEIVTGGSSAVYGSDAITGVVNFVLRDDFEGLEVRPQLNLNSVSDAHTYSVDVTGGVNFAGGRGNVTVAANILNRDSLLRGERGDYAQYSLSNGCIASGSGGTNRPGTPFAVPSGQTCLSAGGQQGFINSGSTAIPNGLVNGLPAFGGANAALNAAYAAAGLTGLTTAGLVFNDDGRTAHPTIVPGDYYNTAPLNYLVQPQKRWMLNSFGHFDISDAATAFTEIHYSRNEVSAQLAANSYSATTVFDVNNPYLSPQLQAVLQQVDLAETGPRTVTAGRLAVVTTPGDGRAAISFNKRLLQTGPRLGIDKRNAFRGVWGLRGNLGEVSETFLTGLHYEAYYSYAHTDESLEERNATSRSAFQASVLSVNGANPVCNVFGQNLSAACIATIATTARSQTVATLHVGQASIGGNLLALPAGPVGFSLGAEWRKSSASFTPDRGLASGDVSGYDAGLPTQGDVAAKEIFGEIRVPLIHDTPFIKQLTLNGAFRVSDYSLRGIGTVWTYLGGVDWRVSGDLAFRGQYQRAIRAPNVQELYGGTSISTIPGVDPCSSRAPTANQTEAVRQLCVATGVPASLVFTAAVQPVGSLSQFSGGNPGLGAEKSDTFTAGVIITPRAIPRLALTIDYYNIKLNGAISPLGGGAQSVLNLCYNTIQQAGSEFCRALNRNPLTGDLFSDRYAVGTLSANTGFLKTSGIDIGLQYSLDLGFGLPGVADTSRLSISSNFNWLDRYDIVPVAAIPNVRYECAGAYGSTCSNVFPKWRGNTRVTWSIGDLSLSVRDRFVGPTTTDRYVVPLRQNATPPVLATLTNAKLPTRNYIDLSFDYTMNDRVEVFGGVNNALNARIPVGDNGAVFPTIFDVIGAEFFIGAKLKVW